MYLIDFKIAVAVHSDYNMCISILILINRPDTFAHLDFWNIYFNQRMFTMDNLRCPGN